MSWYRAYSTIHSEAILRITFGSHIFSIYPVDLFAFYDDMLLVFLSLIYVKKESKAGMDFGELN